mmetsp:Transcript_79787/g.141274  ORF Transcript_79787/g.141274 Transcript_79787/m.141274 type:complete len:491 (+) Transcript_79787:35-1507(+)
MHLQAYFYFRRSLLLPDGSYGSPERLVAIRLLCRELRQMDVNLYLLSSQPVEDIANAVSMMGLAEFFKGRGGLRIFHLTDQTPGAIVRENVSAHRAIPDHAMYVDSDHSAVVEVQSKNPGIAGYASNLEEGYDEKMISHFRTKKMSPPSPTYASPVAFPPELTDPTPAPYAQPTLKGGGRAVTDTTGLVTHFAQFDDDDSGRTRSGAALASPAMVQPALNRVRTSPTSAAQAGYTGQTGAAPAMLPVAMPVRAPQRPVPVPIASSKEMQAFFDFDNTLTKEMVFFDLCKFFRTQRPTGEMAKQMADDWWISEFGGVERIKKLDMMLISLRKMNVKCFICSQNFPDIIEEGLKRVGIAQHFENDSKILRILPKVLPNQVVTNDKGARVASAMAKYSCEAGDAFFADDSKQNCKIVSAALPGIANMNCPETGMKDEDFDKIIEHFKRLSGSDEGVIATSPSAECKYALFAHSHTVGADDSYFIPLHLLGGAC